MTLSLLHLATWAYVKDYQYWCEYLNRKPFVTLFFHLFKCNYGYATRARGRGLIYLESTMCNFRPLLELQPFEDRLFMVVPIDSEVHVTVCVVRDRVRRRCDKLFPKYRIESRFLMRNNLYVYKGDNLFDEARYQKKRLMNFINNIRYFRGGTPWKRFKRNAYDALLTSVCY